MRKKLVSKALKNTLAFLFAFAVFATQAAGVLADPVEAPAVGTNADVSITKELQVGANVKVPSDYKFEFVAELNAVRDNTYTETKYDGVRTINKDITIAPNSPKNASGNYVVESMTFLDSVAANYPHAGEYVYDVTEKAGSLAGVAPYSSAKYTMKVYVKNYDGGLYIGAVTVSKTQDDAGDPATTKVDPGAKGNNGTGNGFRFVNTYTRTTDLVISNNVVGDLADRTKLFSYTLTLNKANVEATAKTYTATIYNADNSPAGTVAVTADGTAANFQLSHGQYLKLEGVASGSTYTVTQAAATNYAPSVTVTENGTAGSAQSDSSGQALPTGTKNIGDDENKAVFTNTYEEPSITGIIVKNLPFILLIGLGLGGLVFFGAAKKRRDTE